MEALEATVVAQTKAFQALSEAVKSQAAQIQKISQQLQVVGCVVVQQLLESCGATLNRSSRQAYFRIDHHTSSANLNKNRVFPMIFTVENTSIYNGCYVTPLALL